MLSNRLLGSASALVLALGLSCGGAAAADAAPGFVAAAVNSPARPQFDVYRDGEFKPADVLAAAGVKPGMVVADLMPDTGYWTRILSLVTGPQGTTYMVVPMGPGGTRTPLGAGPVTQDSNQNYPLNRVQTALTVADQPEFHQNTSVYWEPIDKQFSVPKQLDVVLTANDYHLFKGPEFKQIDTAMVAKNIFRALKSGGMLIVIDNTGADTVKADALGAGFTLDGDTKLGGKDGMFALRFKKPANAPNSDKRPADVKAALAGFFGNTRRSNPGLIGERSVKAGGGGLRERRVMYHPDLTYQEYGQRGTGDNPWQSGTVFYNADGDGCMLHAFPLNERGFIACSPGRAAPNVKMGDAWFAGDRIYEFVGKGYVPFPDKEAEEGGTLGNTPLEIAQGFGRIYRLCEEKKATESYKQEYLGAYRKFRARHASDKAMLDAAFVKVLGHPVAGL